MKILILGNLIDTKYIYNIDEVRNTAVNNSNRYQLFTIYFINKKELNIHLNIYNLGYQISITNKCLEYKYIEKTTKKLNNLRDKLIKIWLKDQINIPKLEFEDENNENNS